MTEQPTLLTVQEYALKVGLTQQAITQRIRTGLKKGIPNGVPTLEGIQCAKRYGRSYILTTEPQALESPKND